MGTALVHADNDSRHGQEVAPSISVTTSKGLPIPPMHSAEPYKSFQSAAVDP